MRTAGPSGPRDARPAAHRAAGIGQCPAGTGRAAIEHDLQEGPSAGRPGLAGEGDDVLALGPPHLLAPGGGALAGRQLQAGLTRLFNQLVDHAEVRRVRARP